MRISCVQANVAFRDPHANAEKALGYMERLKAEGTDLAVFPEAFLTGYCVSSQKDASCLAIERDDLSLKAIQNASDGLDIGVIIGFAEVHEGNLYNTVALFEPGKRARYYRKSHLPFLGYDMFAEPGKELPVFDTKWGKIGILICFDLRVPEATRVLALKGAELIVLPTNWPDGAQVSAEHFPMTRASENRVFYATCDRVGDENGIHFIGLSKIIGMTGKVLAAAGEEEEVISAEIELSEAKIKRNVIIPGVYEIPIFDCRHPEMYEELIAETCEV